MKPKLTLATLKTGAGDFVREINRRHLAELFGVTDGKAVGSFVEHGFHDYLRARYSYRSGSSASGIDFPDLAVDLKVTSIRQPQSSCPFQSAGQKVYGLGYHLMVLVYDKKDDAKKKAARLNFLHAVFVAKEHTADFQTTKGILDILDRNGNQDDLISFLEERNLPLDEIGRKQLADRIRKIRPEQGYLTVSNAFQWRLQYGRIVTLASEGGADGIENLLTQPNSRPRR